MTTALYTGSFDPVTNGHLDIIRRAASIFDKLVVAVAVNTNKQPIFSMQERINFLNENLAGIENIKITSTSGLTVDLFSQEDVNVLIRGVRNSNDLDYEIQISQMNQFLNHKVETVFLPADPKWNFTSSSLIKEVVSMNGNIEGLVPEKVAIALKSRLKMN